MASPDAGEIRAPENSFQTAISITELPDGKLGNDRTRRHVYADQVLPEDLEPKVLQPDYSRPGISRVYDYLPAILAANPLPGERFVVVEFIDDPPYGRSTTYGRHHFVLSDRLRVIDPRSRTFSYPAQEVGFPPIEQIMNEIKVALKIQRTLKSS